MGMGAESFSRTAYSGTCGRHGQWKESKKNSIQFQILNHSPNALLSCEITHMTICTAIQNRFQDWLYTYFALSDEDR